MSVLSQQKMSSVSTSNGRILASVWSCAMGQGLFSFYIKRGFRNHKEHQQGTHIE